MQGENNTRGVFNDGRLPSRQNFKPSFKGNDGQKRQGRTREGKKEFLHPDQFQRPGNVNF